MAGVNERRPGVLYLDVDGVLLAGEPARLHRPARATLHVDGHAVGVLWDRRVVGQLDHVLARTGTRVVWLTGWQEHAAAVLAPAIGLLAGERAAYVDQERFAVRGDYSGTEWKRSGLAADQARAPSPFVWVDDVALTGYPRRGPGEVLASLVRARREAGHVARADGTWDVEPFLCVAADARRGLSCREVALIQRFFTHPDRAPRRRRPRSTCHFPGGPVAAGSDP